MKKLIITEEEKNSLLNLHINEGYKTIMEQSEEVLNTTHDKVWDYKKVGDEYYTKRKTSDKWIKATGTALNAIKTKVKFEPTQQQDKVENQPTQQQDKTEQSIPNNKKTSRLFKCDTIIDAIAYKGAETGKPGDRADVSVMTRKKWKEYFGINLEDTKNPGIIAAIKQLNKDTQNGKKGGYTFTNLKLPINVDPDVYGYALKEDSCCILITRGEMYNYNPNLNKDDDIKAKPEDRIRILVRYKNIKKVDC